jgi:hypothetical protein
MSRTICPTHMISGWFLGAYEGQDEGELCKFDKPVLARYLGIGTYVIIDHCTETLPDGTEVSGEDFYYVEPAVDLPHVITPLTQVVVIGRQAPGLDVLVADVDFAHKSPSDLPQG